MRCQSLMSLLLLAAFCAGCDTERAEPQPQSGSAPAAENPAAAASGIAAAQLYTVDPAASEVYWLISRAGLMARFGHNHVISAENFSGTVTVDPENPTASRFELEIPVADLVVDDPELRSRFGDEFASVPSEEDKAGTRQNMLGENLLMADSYPLLRVRGSGPSDAEGGETLPIEIEILGRSYDFEVPGEIVYRDGDLEATGAFALEHADLGLTPFSALGGALQVGPTIEFAYRIRAVRNE